MQAVTLRSEAASAESFERPDEVLEDDPAEGDRARLAYAIHDGLTQVVTASVLELEALAHRVEIQSVEASEALRQAVRELRRALEEIRGVLAHLTPTDPGKVQPIEDLLKSVLERWQLPATWSVEGDLDEVTESVLEEAS